MASRTAYYWGLAWVAALVMFSSAAHALTPSQVFDAVKDSVVVVKTLDAKGEEIAMGSGVLLPGGKVATNCHVIKDGANFQLGRGKQFVVATVYAGDGDKDICLLDAKDIVGKPATLGKASSLKIGEPVYAVGAPQGLELSLSDGIVSQLRGGSPPFIQTTAAISPGSSGGGLFDSEAQLVGFTTLYIDGGQSLNFAMPVEWLAEIKMSSKITKQGRSQADWLARAVALEEAKDWKGLLAWGRQWAKAQPKNGQAWYALGIAYGKLDRPNDAIDAYRQALRIEPEAASIWNNVGSTYNQLDRPNEAIDALRQALRIDPESAESWQGIGVAYFSLKRHSDAINAFRQALRIDPEYVNAWSMLAAAYHFSGNTVAALDTVRTLRRLDPEKAEELFNIFAPR